MGPEGTVEVTLLIQEPLEPLGCGFAQAWTRSSPGAMTVVKRLSHSQDQSNPLLALRFAAVAESVWPSLTQGDLPAASPFLIQSVRIS
jgi:hypothetical protein